MVSIRAHTLSETRTRTHSKANGQATCWYDHAQHSHIHKLSSMQKRAHIRMCSKRACVRVPVRIYLSMCVCICVFVCVCNVLVYVYNKAHHQCTYTDINYRTDINGSVSKQDPHFEDLKVNAAADTTIRTNGKVRVFGALYLNIVLVL